MILFYGIPSEDPLDRAISAAERLGLPSLLLNQRHSAHANVTLAACAHGLDGRIEIGASVVSLADLSGIYARPTAIETLPELRAGGSRAPEPKLIEHFGAVHELMNDVLDAADLRVANRPAAMGSNMSKPFQAQIIRAAGLATPETLVTNDPDAVRAFHSEQGRIIYKSISGVRSIVREWAPASGPDLVRVAALPTQFQAFVPGVNIRVHVVADALFATEIRSETIDYRYGESDMAMRPIALPADVAATCIALTAALGLFFSGIDLKQTPDGRFFCFEVNPSPAYSFFEGFTGQPIAETLALTLAGRR